MFFVALVYLSAPVFIMLFTFFSLPYVVLTAAVLVVFVFCLHRSYYTEREVFRVDINCKRYWPLLIVVLMVVLVVLPSFPLPNIDWYRTYALLNTLINNAWPPTVDWRGNDMTLRYYLAYFIVPALGAKLFGYYCLTYLVALWTALGLCLALLISLHNVPKSKHVLVATIIILFFSGLDLIGSWVLNDRIPTDDMLSWWWTWGQISPNMFTITWVPQHGIAAWVATSMFLYNPRLSLKYGGIIGAVVAMWSPFVAIGLIPIVAWSIWKEGLMPALSWQNFVLTWLGLPIVLYLTTDIAQLPSIFFWEDGHDYSAHQLVLFFLLEFWIIATVIYWIRRQDAQLIIINIAFVMCISLFRLGGANDLLMRSSMSLVFILSLLCVRALLQARHAGRVILLVLWLIGAVPLLLAQIKVIFSPRETNIAAIDFNNYYPFHLLLTVDPDIEEKAIPQYLVKREKLGAEKIIGVPLLRNI